MSFKKKENLLFERHKNTGTSTLRVTHFFNEYELEYFDQLVQTNLGEIQSFRDLMARRPLPGRDYVDSMVGAKSLGSPTVRPLKS